MTVVSNMQRWLKHATEFDVMLLLWNISSTIQFDPDQIPWKQFLQVELIDIKAFVSNLTRLHSCGNSSFTRTFPPPPLSGGMRINRNYLNPHRIKSLSSCLFWSIPEILFKMDLKIELVLDPVLKWFKNLIQIPHINSEDMLIHIRFNIGSPEWTWSCSSQIMIWSR